MYKLVEQTPRYRLVAQQIADLILEGNLRPKEKMPAERELVESLGVSRATVREALIALEIAGFVENRFGAGMAVSANPPVKNTLAKVSGPGPFELLDARLLVEGEIAALAVERISKEEIETLKSLTKSMSEEGESEFWGENADERFHVTIARSTGNLALELTIRDFWRQRVSMPMWVKMHNRVNVSSMKDALVLEHEEIINALECRNPEGARTAMRRHISQFGSQLLDAWAAIEDTSEKSVDSPGILLRRELDR